MVQKLVETAVRCQAVPGSNHRREVLGPDMPGAKKKIRAVSQESF